MSDAIHVLEEQHVEVTALFMKIERAADPVLRAQIFRSIDVRLRDHGLIEEQIFYPAFRRKAGDGKQAGEVEEALHDHQHIKDQVSRLEQLDPASAQFLRELASLKAAVLDHVQEERRGILRQSRRLFSEAELDELALRMTMTAALSTSVYEIGARA